MSGTSGAIVGINHLSLTLNFAQIVTQNLNHRGTHGTDKSNLFSAFSVPLRFNEFTLPAAPHTPHRTPSAPTPHTSCPRDAARRPRSPSGPPSPRGSRA